MSDVIPQSAPGCFGSALAYSNQNSICAACVFGAGCSPMHSKNLKAIQKKLGLKVSQIEEKKVENAIVKRAKLLVETFQSYDLNVQAKLREGVNPFNADLPYMHITCHMFLRASEPIGPNHIALAFINHLKWSVDKAENHADIVIEVLKQFGVIKNVADKFILKDQLCTQS